MTLKEIMDTEACIVKETQTLHSDMQTLVYENYNKFISATDTIRKMKMDFKQMETEMNLLQENMDSITSFSEEITGTLQDTRQQLCKLSGKYSLLKKLQFLSTLPANLKALIHAKNYAQAVQDYGHAQKVLQHYGDHPSFHGIREDCLAMVAEMRADLRLEFQMSGQSAESLTKCGELLLHLGERPSHMSKSMLANANQRLYEQIVMLQDQTDRDMLEFIDLCIDGFLNDLNLVVSSYTDMFLRKDYLDSEPDDFQETCRRDLDTFIAANMQKYLHLIGERVDAETGKSDSQVLLRALDRLHRRLTAMKSLNKALDMAQTGKEIVLNAAKQLCRTHLQHLTHHFNDSMSALRLQLATTVRQSSSSVTTTTPDTVTGGGGPNLNEMISGLYFSVIEKAKGVLQDLLIFLLPEWSFNLKSAYKELFCVTGIRENLLVVYLRTVLTTVNGFGDVHATGPPNLLLILVRLCLELDQAGIHTLMALVDDLYEIDSVNSAELTHETELCEEARHTAQRLIDAYVRSQGLVLSQMLRKSVESRDWLNCLEPRSVRAVMKRVVEELNAIELVVNELFKGNGSGQQQQQGQHHQSGGGGQGSITTASSDSSRKTHFRSNWSVTPSQLDSAFVHRLFSERIEIFGSVEFNRTSILTGIIKICLKTLLECIRVKTLSKYGLQQIQVDAHYLQMHLWKFVSDEK